MDCNRIAGPCQREHDRAADAPRSAGDKGGSA